MHSRIQIGFLAVRTLLLFAPFLTFAQTRPQPFPPLDSLNLASMGRIGVQLFGTAQGLKMRLKEQTPDLEKAQGLALNQLALAKADSTIPKNQIDSLTKVAKFAKNAYKKGFDLTAKAEKLTQFTLALADMDSLNLRKNLPKAWKQVNQIYDELYPPIPTEKPANETIAEKESKPKKEKKKKESPPTENPNSDSEPSADQPVTNTPIANKPITSLKRFAAYNPATDVMLRPPTPPCKIASSSRDEFSGEISRQLAAAEFFRYTNPALKTYLQGKTHVICEAALSSSGPNIALQLTFIINDPNARKAFGRLEKNSVATLKFLDGSTFELQNALADEGTFNPENDGSIFQGHYPLNAEALKKIRRNGLDRIRILWSKGYDDYEVQQVDLLMRQAECLLK